MPAIAIPTPLTCSIGSILTFCMNHVLVNLFLAAPAVYVICSRGHSFAALPVCGVRNTIVTVIAYNLGAGSRNGTGNVVRPVLTDSAAFMVIGTALF